VYALATDLRAPPDIASRCLFDRTTTKAHCIAIDCAAGFRPVEFPESYKARIGPLVIPPYLIPPKNANRMELNSCFMQPKLKMLGGVTMAKGTVKWFNASKGFGFIQPDNGGPDIFVHISAVERAGLSTLQDGQKVQYELVPDRRTGKASAENLQMSGTHGTGGGPKD